MQAGAGCYIPAVGHHDPLLLLLVPIVAVSGAAILFLMASISRMPTGEIRVRVLGITVRWGQPTAVGKTEQDSSPSNPDKKRRKRYRLRGIDRDDLG